MRAAETTGSARLRGCDEVGEGVVVHGKPYVHNLGYIAIADRVELKSEPVVTHLVTGPHGRLEIGVAARIAHGVALAAHHHVTIGAGAEIGAFAMIMDTDFHEAGNHGSAGESAPIVIGARAKLGARVTVLRGSVIGEDAVVGAGSVVKGVVAPGAHVAGVPARPSVGAGAGADDHAPTLERIQAVVAHTFGLSSVPEPTRGRADLAAWDSLGALNLLLSLEDAFGIQLRERDMVDAATIADLQRMVEDALSTH